MLEMIYQTDSYILQSINAYMGQYPLFDNLMFALTYIDLFKNGILILIFYWLWFRKGVEQRSNREKLTTAIVASGVVVVLTRTISHFLPFVERPIYNQTYHFIVPSMFDTEGLNNWSSLISDHAALAFALATGIISVSRGFGIFAYFWAFFGICFPRIYFGFHYPSDILQGAVIGTGTALFCLYWKPILKLISTPLLKWEDVHPSSFYTVTFFISYELIERMDEVIHIAKLSFKHFGVAV